jgi:aspartate/methionine/tyrosine aminotransferase
MPSVLAPVILSVVQPGAPSFRLVRHTPEPPMFVSQRLQAVQSPVIPVVGQLVRDHPGCISLGQGIVHYGPPPNVGEAVARFLTQPDAHRYQAVVGIPALHELLTAKLAAENGIVLAEQNRLVVTAGGNMAFVNAVLAIADPGDEIILVSPYYFNHEMAITMFGCRAVSVPCGPDYSLDVAAIRRAIGPRTKAIVTISPNNPSGAVYAPTALAEVNALCRELGIYHISDEAYEYFVYDDARHFSPASLPGAAAHTISLFSLSKAYGMASWRVGYMVIPERLLSAVQKVQDTNLICPPVVSQHAACAALRVGRGYCDSRIVELGAVRHMVLERFEAVRHTCMVSPSSGAFYFLLRLDTRLTPMQVVERLVCEYGVAVIPGTTFGLQEGCTLRLAYGALDRETVAEGIGRLVRGIAAIG